MVADRAGVHDADLRGDVRGGVSCVGAVFSGIYFYRSDDVEFLFQMCDQQCKPDTKQPFYHYKDLYAEIYPAVVQDAGVRV